MKANSPVSFARSGPKGKAALLSVLLIGALLALAVPFLSNLATVNAATGAGSFDNVQVAIHTSTSLPDSYSVSAYNMTGGLVASYQSQYPAAAFELPSGAYIFTATATQQQTVYYPVGLESGSATAGSSGSSGSSGGAIVSPPIKCCTPPAQCCVVPYTQPVVEYGYVSQQVSGPTSLTISTAQLNQTSTSTLTIKLSYPNGTAASGVYVSASVLGDDYGWAYGSGTVSMYNSTDSKGTVTLVAPTAPVLVSASASIPIVLPYNQSTVQVTVAGVKVNVTTNWEPNYVSFSGQLLIVPPQTSGNIVLQYQPQSPGPILYASGQTATGATAGVPASSGATGQTTSAQRVAAVQQATTGVQSPSSSTDVLLISGVAAALSIAALSVALFKSRSKPTVQ